MYREFKQLELAKIGEEVAAAERIVQEAREAAEAQRVAQEARETVKLGENVAGRQKGRSFFDNKMIYSL